MDMYAFRTLRGQPLRLALTVGGVASCIVLMLFLLAVYRGAADGSVEYVRRNAADLWVLQKNASNILRGSSLVTAAQAEAVGRVPGVRSVATVLLLLSTLRKDGEARTIFLAGYEPEKALGGPPELARGRAVRTDGEIVLDAAFARKFGFKTGDAVDLQGRRLEVVGLSRGTNAFVIQYAFVTLRLARTLVGIPGLATCFLVTAEAGADADGIRGRIRSGFPALEAYDQREFLAANIREMKSGFLPLLYTVAALGAVVLTVILSLLLSINIMERRKDFAVLKTLGSPLRFLWGLVVRQAVLIATLSALAALLVFFPLAAALESLAPEVSLKSSAGQILAVALAVEVMSLASSLVSIRRLRRVYYLEVFS